MTKACTYSIVIPCHRSGAWLDELVQRIQAVMQEQDESFEVLLVNDASLDQTWQVITQICRRHANVRGFDLLRNVGQMQAILCGLESARGEFVITMDDDDQHRPEDIPKLIQALQANPDLDCVIGGFKEGKHRRYVRDLGTVMLRWMLTLLYGAPSTLRMSSFSIMKRPVVSALRARPTARALLSLQLLQSTHRITNVEVDYQPRRRGVSGYTMVRLALILWETVVSTSPMPLRLVGLVGVGIASISVGIGVTSLIQIRTGGQGVSGPVAVVVAGAFFSGLILLAIGLLGEYLISIRQAASSASLYQLRDQIGGAE